MASSSQAKVSHPTRRTITFPSQAVSTLSGAVVVFTTPGNDGHGYHPIGPNDTALSFITKSTDDGLTWEELRPIPGVLGAGLAGYGALQFASTPGVIAAWFLALFVAGAGIGIASDCPGHDSEGPGVMTRILPSGRTRRCLALR